MVNDLRTRSYTRMAIAMVLLVIAMVILGYGFFMVINQFNAIANNNALVTPDFSDSTEVAKFDFDGDKKLNGDETKKALAIIQTASNNKSSIEDTVFNFFSRMVLLTIVFFMAQVLIKLYKYNIAKSDYFLSCADALTLAAELKKDEMASFDQALKLLEGHAITLDTPDTPVLPQKADARS